MHTVHKRLHESEDEDDLEYLRLEALKSLKKPPHLDSCSPIISPVSILEPSAPTICNNPAFNIPPKGGIKRGRYNGNGRIARNGSYNNRVRNYNLIAVPTIESDLIPDSSTTKFIDKPTPKLILPQDRYSGSMLSEEKISECGSKFDRYNDSEDSGTDSELELDNKTKLSPKVETKLERSNSLEALLQELDNEIQGVSKPSEQIKFETPPKPKVDKLKTTEKLEVNVSVLHESDSAEDKFHDKEEDCIPSNEEMQPYDSNSLPIALVNPEVIADININFDNQQSFIQVTNQNNLLENAPLQPFTYIDQSIPVASIPQLYVPLHYQHFPNSTLYNNSLPYPFPNLNAVIEPPRILRPLSPLAIKTDILNTVTAPLSPRSAAFVLQNREIIERRKKSPRRSYSRSSSPEYRDSVSPRFRKSPKRSPKHSPNCRVSPVRNLARRYSPKLKSNSTHCSPKPTTNSPSRRTRHNRNEIINMTEDENKISIQVKSSAICRSPSSNHSSRTNSPVDAILEARRKKFGTCNAVATEGVIRLKPKMIEDETVVDTTEIQEVANEKDVSEELLLGNDELDLGISVTHDIFSDEDESDDHNEGRFKTGSRDANSVSLGVSFSQLLNETSTMISEKHNGSKKSLSENKKHRVPSNSSNYKRKSLKHNLRLNADLKAPRRKPPIVSPIENKKIEIKIRNPSKYESNSSIKQHPSEIVRKVEVSNTSITEDHDMDILIQDENDGDSKSKGDLRTQLSRKRAERHNIPTRDRNQSRLLQSALQGAIYKRTLKINKEKDETSIDTKLPIHLRLGIPGSLDNFTEVSVQKKPKKRSKDKGNLDQV